MKKLLYLTALVFILISCNDTNDNNDNVLLESIPAEVSDDMNYEASVDEYSYSPENDYVSGSHNGLISLNAGSSFANTTKKPKKLEEQKIIWTGNIKFQVNDIDKSTKYISSLVAKYHGNISNLQYTKSYGEISNVMVVKLNSKSFNKLINALKASTDSLDIVEINSSDVTEEFVDIKSRLKTKKDARQRYIDILRNKTGSIKDIIAAEEAIRRITEEIESKEGRLRYLQNKVNYSTINIKIYQDIEITSIAKLNKKSYFEDINRAFGNGWSIIKYSVLFLINIWPIILVVLLGFIFRRAYVKSKKK